MIPKSVVHWRVDENLAAVETVLDEIDMQRIAELDVKARYNDPSLDYGRRPYDDPDGTESIVNGQTHWAGMGFCCMFESCRSNGC